MSDDRISDNEAIDAALHLDGDPDRVRGYYDDWASDYDGDVAGAGYRAPQICARLLRQFRPDTAIRLLDAGCGTGLVGVELNRLGYCSVDGFDLSESMAERARCNGCYGEVRGAVDMMQAAQVYVGQDYDAVLSAGVFTLGHVPPEALFELLALSRLGGLLIVSTRSQYYDATGFQQILDELLRDSRIRILRQVRNALYNHDGDGHYWVLEKTG
jgi:predicted TPR repeat methyltransferase